MEEKYGKKSISARGKDREAGGSESDGDSTSEEEDDEAVLATDTLDAEITATIQAIRSRDPRVYDEKATFYSRGAEGETEEHPGAEKKEKPIFLRDYHRQNLLAGNIDVEMESDVPKTYLQEQEELKRDVVREMHAAADREQGSQTPNGDKGSEDDDERFLKPKTKPEPPLRRPKLALDKAVAEADKDPDFFLSNFMASRAWVPTSSSKFQPFDSDDEEEEERADAFEEAYNLRFEDPAGANEKIVAYARDATAKHSVRRDELSGRKKAREMLREKKEAEERQRGEEKARLRKLKVEEAEERIKKIKEAAGLKGKTVKVDEWADLLGGDWDDQQWEEEMQKRFGDDYYAAGEGNSEDDAESNGLITKMKVKKPKWNDGIDIHDLVPDFADEEAEAPFEPSDDDDNDMVDGEQAMAGEVATQRRKTKKDRVEERRLQKKIARLERQQLEEFVDDRLDPDALLPSSSKKARRFRYRETSPTTYGLTARDILLASDQQLNEYAGLKKLATFRDAEKKRKDKRRLGKKARLRQWRKDTFGHEDGPRVVIGQGDGTAHHQVMDKGRPMDGVNGVDGGQAEKGKKRRKRSGKSKGKITDA